MKMGITAAVDLRLFEPRRIGLDFDIRKSKAKMCARLSVYLKTPYKKGTDYYE